MRNFGLDLSTGIVALPTILHHRASECGDRLFLIDVSGDSATYATALARASQWAGALATFGIGPETTVSTMLPNSVEATIIWMALTGLRAWEAPVHPSYQGMMLEHAVNTVQSTVLIIDSSLFPRLAESSLPALTTVIVIGSAAHDSAPYDVIAASSVVSSSSSSPLADDIGGHELASIIYTSGTTGPSKGVMVPWAQLAAFSVRQFPYEDFTPDDCWYLFTPSSHIGAKSWPYLAAMVGGQVVIRPEFKTDRFAADIQAYGVTTTAMVPAVAHFLSLSAPSASDSNLPLRNVVMAGALPSPEAFASRFGVRMCTTYSMTEICTPFTSDRWNVTNWDSVGLLKGGYPDVEVRVVDDHDAVVGPGVVGELIIRTSEPWTMNAGYFGMPSATADAWRNGWFHTGDGFRYDEDGFYYFVDRIKDTIRRRGENISSFEVEAIATGHPAVAESAAVAVPSDMGEDEIKLCVVPAAGATLDPAALIAWMVSRVPGYMVPRYVEVLPSLPRTMGTLRVQKGVLRASGVTADTWDRISTASQLS